MNNFNSYHFFFFVFFFLFLNIETERFSILLHIVCSNSKFIYIVINGYFIGWKHRQEACYLYKGKKVSSYGSAAALCNR